MRDKNQFKWIEMAEPASNDSNHATLLFVNEIYIKYNSYCI